MDNPKTSITLKQLLDQWEQEQRATTPAVFAIGAAFDRPTYAELQTSPFAIKEAVGILGADEPAFTAVSNAVEAGAGMTHTFTPDATRPGDTIGRVFAIFVDVGFSDNTSLAGFTLTATMVSRAGRTLTQTVEVGMPEHQRPRLILLPGTTSAQKRLYTPAVWHRDLVAGVGVYGTAKTIVVTIAAGLANGVTSRVTLGTIGTNEIDSIVAAHHAMKGKTLLDAGRLHRAIAAKQRG